MVVVVFAVAEGLRSDRLVSYVVSPAAAAAVVAIVVAVAGMGMSIEWVMVVVLVLLLSEIERLDSSKMTHSRFHVGVRET